jgi:hypothetical protein
LAYASLGPIIRAPGHPRGLVVSTGDALRKRGPLLPGSGGPLSWPPRRSWINLTKWANEEAIYADGAWFDRKEVIKFGPDKLGGAHYGRDESKQSGKVVKLYRWASERTPMHSHPPVQLEILAMAQTLAEAPDSHRLLGEIRVVIAAVSPRDDPSRWKIR